MVKAENGSYEGMLFDLAEPLDYVIEAAGVRSASHKLNVVELPYAKKIDLEYTYPSYTGLEPRKIEDGGDIAVLKGTDVKLTITPTMASKGGQVVLGEKESVPLAANADGTLSANFTAAARRLLSHRARCAERRAADGVAAVHGRPAVGPRADRQAVEARPRHRRDAGRGVLRRSARRR